MTIDYVDPTSHNSTDFKVLSISFIIMNHYWYCIKVGSQEWHGGYFQEMYNKGGGSVEIYVQAPHEAYSNAVDILSDACSPFYDDIMKQDEAQHRAELLMVKEQFEKTYSDPITFKTQWGYEKATMKRELFRSLSRFLLRNNYIEEPTIQE